METNTEGPKDNDLYAMHTDAEIILSLLDVYSRHNNAAKLVIYGHFCPEYTDTH